MTVHYSKLLNMALFHFECFQCLQGIYILYFVSLYVDGLASRGFTVVPVQVKRRDTCELVVDKGVVWKCSIPELLLGKIYEST